MWTSRYFIVDRRENSQSSFIGEISSRQSTNGGYCMLSFPGPDGRTVSRPQPARKVAVSTAFARAPASAGVPSPVSRRTSRAKMDRESRRKTVAYIGGEISPTLQLIYKQSEAARQQGPVVPGYRLPLGHSVGPQGAGR